MKTFATPAADEKSPADPKARRMEPMQQVRRLLDGLRRDHGLEAGVLGQSEGPSDYLRSLAGNTRWSSYVPRGNG